MTNRAKDVGILAAGGGDENPEVAQIGRSRNELERSHGLGHAPRMNPVQSASEVCGRVRSARSGGNQVQVTQRPD
jgi:hypothetical protein